MFNLKFNINYFILLLRVLNMNCHIFINGKYLTKFADCRVCSKVKARLDNALKKAQDFENLGQNESNKS